MNLFAQISAVPAARLVFYSQTLFACMPVTHKSCWHDRTLIPSKVAPWHAHLHMLSSYSGV